MHKISSCLLTCLGIGILLLSATANCQPEQPTLIEEVMGGQRQEAKASWWGFNAVDSTDNLQQAINSKVPRLIIDKMPAGPWITQPLQLVSNQEIVFEEGVELQALRGAYKGRNDSMINAVYIENVVLRGLGQGASLRMFKADYHTDAYTKAEWRHGILLRGTKNVRIENLSIIDSGGDGIYLGSGKGRYCTDTVISKVTCDGNNRQGISVIAAINLLIEDTVLCNTWGTAPQAGIDFEPNHAHEPLINCVMRNCTTENNAGDGYVFYLPNMDTEKHSPISITLENCISKYDKSRAFAFTTRSRKPPHPATKGTITVTNCFFEGSGRQAIAINTKANDDLSIDFNRVTANNCGANSVSPIFVSTHNYVDGSLLPGRVSFQDVIIHESVERSVLQYSDTTFGGYYPNHLQGAITKVLHSQATTQELSQQWLRDTFPPKLIKRLPIVDLSKVTWAPLKKNPGSRDLSGLRYRRGGDFMLYAQQGEAITFTALYGQLATLSGQTAKVTLTTPNGRKIALGDIAFKEQKSFSLPAAPETGLYRLNIPGGSNWIEIKQCNQPIAKAGAIDFVTTIGDAFFQVPENTKTFAVQLWGEGTEGSKAAIYDPDGKQVWEKDNITELEQFLAAPEQAAKAGVWKLRLDRASEAYFEDFHVELTGIPSVISPDPELLLTTEE